MSKKVSLWWEGDVMWRRSEVKYDLRNEQGETRGLDIDNKEDKGSGGVKR